MPTKPATSTTFQQFIQGALSKHPDQAAAQQFTSTFGDLLTTAPATLISELDNQTASSIMFHKDYSRLISEQRQQASSLQQQAAQLQTEQQQLQQLQAQSVNRGEYEALQQQLEATRLRAAGVDTLLNKLDAMDLTELVLEADEIAQFRSQSQGDTKMPATNPNDSNNGNQPPANQPAPQWDGRQWVIPVASYTPPPQQFQQQPSQQQPDLDAMVNARVEAALAAVLPQMASQVYGASTQSAHEVNAFVNEYASLGKGTLDPRQVNREFVESGKQFNEFLEDKYQLANLREEKRAADFTAAVEAAAETKAQQRLSEMVTAGTLRNGVPSNGSIPLFDAIASKPQGLRQAYQQPYQQNPATPGYLQPPTPQAAPTATSQVPNGQPVQQQQLASTPPPNPQDQGGMEAAARALQLGTYANGRFDPTRPLGMPGVPA